MKLAHLHCHLSIRGVKISSTQGRKSAKMVYLLQNVYLLKQGVQAVVHIVTLYLKRNSFFFLSAIRHITVYLETLEPQECEVSADSAADSVADSKLLEQYLYSYYWESAEYAESESADSSHSLEPRLFANC